MRINTEKPTNPVADKVNKRLMDRLSGLFTYKTDEASQTV